MEINIYFKLINYLNQQAIYFNLFFKRRLIAMQNGELFEHRKSERKLNEIFLSF